MSRTSFPVHTASGPVARLIWHVSLCVLRKHAPERLLIGRSMFSSSSRRLYADRFSLTVLPVALPIRPSPNAIVTLKNRTLSPVVERFLERTAHAARSRSSAGNDQPPCRDP
jgi:hypothetical protein